jgi:hypothetical protein
LERSGTKIPRWRGRLFLGICTDRFLDAGLDVLLDSLDGSRGLARSARCESHAGGHLFLAASFSGGSLSYYYGYEDWDYYGDGNYYTYAWSGEADVD